MRRRILTKLENEQNMSLQQLADYCQQHVNIKQDSQKIEAGIANVRRNWKSPTSTNKNHYKKIHHCQDEIGSPPPSSTNKNHEENSLLAHAMEADNSTGTRTARTSTKFVETATERDRKCRAVKN